MPTISRVCQERSFANGRQADSSELWGRISVANGVGFVGNDDVLEAFDIETGALLSSYSHSGGTLAGVITIANGRVAFGEGLEWFVGKTGKMLTVLSLPDR